MEKILLLVVLSTVLTVGYAKHVHPRNVIHKMDDVDLEEESAIDSDPISTDIDGMPIEVIRHIKQSRFVPVNNVLFFMTYPPCEDGFKRDLLGVCREVWE